MNYLLRNWLTKASHSVFMIYWLKSVKGHLGKYTGLVTLWLQLWNEYEWKWRKTGFLSQWCGTLNLYSRCDMRMLASCMRWLSQMVSLMKNYALMTIKSVQVLFMSIIITTWQRFYHRLSLNSPLPIWSHCAIMSYDGKYPFNNIIYFIFYIITNFSLLNSCCLLL